LLGRFVNHGSALSLGTSYGDGAPKIQSMVYPPSRSLPAGVS
jgi:hypothetical protein